VKESKRRKVTAPAAAGSLWKMNHGRYVVTGSSRSSVPASTSLMMSVAVRAFVVEPMQNKVCGVTGAPSSTLVTPNPRA